MATSKWDQYWKIRTKIVSIKLSLRVKCECIKLAKHLKNKTILTN